MFALLRGIAAGADGAGAPAAADPQHHAAAGDRQHLPAGALTPSVVMSLGLGLAVLVTITQIDGNLRRQFMAALPEHAPSFYFIDIPANEADRFGAFVKQAAPQSTVEDVPMLRGRIVAARGVKAEDLGASTFGDCRQPRVVLRRTVHPGFERLPVFRGDRHDSSVKQGRFGRLDRHATHEVANRRTVFFRRRLKDRSLRRIDPNAENSRAASFFSHVSYNGIQARAFQAQNDHVCNPVRLAKEPPTCRSRTPHQAADSRTWIVVAGPPVRG